MTSYIRVSHAEMDLQDDCVLCCHYMNLFFSITYGYDLVFIGADYLLHI